MSLDLLLREKIIIIRIKIYFTVLLFPKPLAAFACKTPPLPIRAPRRPLPSTTRAKVSLKTTHLYLSFIQSKRNLCHNLLFFSSATDWLDSLLESPQRRNIGRSGCRWTHGNHCGIHVYHDNE